MREIDEPSTPSCSSDVAHTGTPPKTTLMPSSASKTHSTCTRGTKPFHIESSSHRHKLSPRCEHVIHTYRDRLHGGTKMPGPDENGMLPHRFHG